MLLLAAMSLGWVMAGASAADLATTEIALRQPGLSEANPFMQTPATRVLLKTAGTVIVISAHRELKRRKKHKTAKIVAITAIAIWSGAAVNNAIRMREK
jgi:hypothetical protein